MCFSSSAFMVREKEVQAVINSGEYNFLSGLSVSDMTTAEVDFLHHLVSSELIEKANTLDIAFYDLKDICFDFTPANRCTEKDVKNVIKSLSNYLNKKL